MERVWDKDKRVQDKFEKFLKIVTVEILGMLSVYHYFLILFSVEILGMFKY